MAKVTSKQSRGSKLTRSMTVTVRLDAKLRYLAEIAALKQRRTLSSFIEWAIEASLSQVTLSPPDSKEAITVADEAEHLWDVDKTDRFAKLALNYPELLTHDEQKIWKRICESESVWYLREDRPSGKQTWSITEENLNFEKLRKDWDWYESDEAAALMRTPSHITLKRT